MDQMVNHHGFAEEDIHQNLDTLRLQSKAEDAVYQLDDFLNEKYDAGIEAALLTRSGHYGMSLMADSALMIDRYGEDEVEAQEVADIDICILLEDDADVEEARYQFKTEEGDSGDINQMCPGIEINPRILYSRDFKGKMNKAAGEWQKDGIQESIRFPAVDGDETMRRPAEFIGYFHQGYTPIVSDSDVEQSIQEATDVITSEDGEVYNEIWDEVWGDFESRMEYKPRAMRENYEMGAAEMTKRNSQKIDFTEYDEFGGLRGVSEELKRQVLEDTDVENNVEGADPNDPFNTESDSDQSRLGDYDDIGVEPVEDFRKECVRKKTRRFLDSHPDISRSSYDGEHAYFFGPARVEEFFQGDPEFKLAEDAVKRKMYIEMSGESEENTIEDEQQTLDALQ